MPIEKVVGMNLCMIIVDCKEGEIYREITTCLVNRKFSAENLEFFGQIVRIFFLAGVNCSFLFWVNKQALQCANYNI